MSTESSQAYYYLAISRLMWHPWVLFHDFCAKSWAIDNARWITSLRISFIHYVSICVSLAWSFSKKLVRCHEVSGIALTMCCRLKVRRLFSSLSREMLTFSRLIQHTKVPFSSEDLLCFMTKISSLWDVFVWIFDCSFLLCYILVRQFILYLNV